MISRRKGLQPSGKPIKRTRWPLRKIAPAKMQAARHYAKRAKAFKVANPFCLAGIPPALCNCHYYTNDVHHLQGRGPNLLVESTWMPICRSCHTWLHQNPGPARKLGLIV